MIFCLTLLGHEELPSELHWIQPSGQDWRLLHASNIYRCRTWACGAPREFTSTFRPFEELITPFLPLVGPVITTRGGGPRLCGGPPEASLEGIFTSKTDSW